jgi:hypothetical protein
MCVSTELCCQSQSSHASTLRLSLRAKFTPAACSYSARYCFISLILRESPGAVTERLETLDSYLKESVLAKPDVSLDARSGSERSTLER